MIREVTSLLQYIAQKRRGAQRKHKHSVLETTDMEDRSPQARSRTDAALDQTECPKTEQHQQTELKKRLPNVVATNLERPCASNEAKHGSIIRKKEAIDTRIKGK